MNQIHYQTVRVDLAARSYDVEIGTKNLSHLRAILDAFLNVQHVVILTDANVAPLYAENIAEHLAAHDLTVDMMIIEPGEESKSIASAECLWEKLLEIGTDRQSVMLAVGGGVVGDLAGFIAATYARGIRFFQIPTTLLAQVDSSVGGKVGVNLSGGKNMVGAFYQPLGVLIDTKTLDTLDESQYLAGLGEVVKYGVSLDAELFELLENNIDRVKQRNHALLTSIVARCCRIKADVVEKDELETLGLRAKLNYGHTFAHAYETLSGYGTLLHGLAVAIGLVDAARLARKLDRVNDSFVERQITVNEQLGLPVRYDKTREEEMIDLMTHDKKSVRGSLRFILPTKIGQCELVTEISPEIVKETLCSALS
ncbi:MAG: 3-dehydroquinate synthase [Planctomycetaceae bacterium]|jgi:3-dehydroquinate synthase|nr:3-dehydroquinate synthase [Planctomycetaceae bacterium]